MLDCKQGWHLQLFFSGIQQITIPSPKIPKNILDLKVAGNPDAAIKFLGGFDTLFNGQEPKDGLLSAKISDFVKILSEMLVENEIFDQNCNVKLLATFGMRILHLDGKESRFKNHILCLGIDGANVKTNILTTNNIRTLTIAGKQELREPFLTSLLLIIAKYGPSASPEKKLPILAKILLDLLVENELLEPDNLPKVVGVLGKDARDKLGFCIASIPLGFELKHPVGSLCKCSWLACARIQ